MKSLLVLAVLVSGNLLAGERVLINDSKEMAVDINHQTVFCSGRGYGFNEQLKINIKALDGWTVLDHTNSIFGDNRNLPCMTAGACKGPFNQNGFDIDDLIQNNPRQETIVVFRKLVERRDLGPDQKCAKTLVEHLETKVGGIKFTHSRSLAAGFFTADMCTF